MTPEQFIQHVEGFCGRRMNEDQTAAWLYELRGFTEPEIGRTWEAFRLECPNDGWIPAAGFVRTCAAMARVYAGRSRTKPMSLADPYPDIHCETCAGAGMIREHVQIGSKESVFGGLEQVETVLERGRIGAAFDCSGGQGNEYITERVTHCPNCEAGERRRRMIEEACKKKERR